MTLSLRQKLTIIPLLLYWPTIFVLAHIPIPQLVYMAQVSDKALHFLAYLILAFLLWFAISPDRKVNWRRAVVWWVLFVVVWYGVVDEWLQGYVGRNCDFMDFAANLAGVVTGLILFSFFTFWSALLIVTGTTIFLLANLARANLADLLPVTNTVFHPLAYGLFTVLWIRCIHLFLSLKAPKLKRLIVTLALPAGLLLVVRLFSIILGRDFRPRDVILSVAAITAVVVINFLTALFHRDPAQNSKTVTP